GGHPNLVNLGARPGYKVMTGQGWWDRFWNGNRTYGGRVVDSWGVLTNRRAPIAGVPNGLVGAAGIGGPNLIKVGNTIRQVIRDLKWSSKSVALAAKLLKMGAKNVVVKSRSEAEELYMAIYQEAGYANVTGIKP